MPDLPLLDLLTTREAVGAYNDGEEPGFGLALMRVVAAAAVTERRSLLRAIDKRFGGILHRQETSDTNGEYDLTWGCDLRYCTWHKWLKEAGVDNPS